MRWPVALAHAAGARGAIVSSSGTCAERRVANTPNTFEATLAENGSGAAEEPDGDSVGKLAGDRGLLAYNAWEICTAVPRRARGAARRRRASTRLAVRPREVVDALKRRLSA